MIEPAIRARAAAVGVLVAALAVASAATANPHLPPIEGDWEVSTPIILVDASLTIRGKVLVENGGSLDLRGVTLDLEGGRDGDAGIEVRSGGVLLARPSPATGRRTRLRRAGRGRFSFAVRRGADFLLDRTLVAGAGWDEAHPGLVVEGYDSGQSPRLRIVQAEFRGGFAGVTLRESSLAIAASRFRRHRRAAIALYRSSAVLTGVDIREEAVAIRATRSTLTVDGGWISENGTGVAARDSTVTVGHSVFVSNARHVRLVGNAPARIHDSVLLFARDVAVAAGGGALPRLEHDDFVGNTVAVNHRADAAGPRIPATDCFWGSENGPSGAGDGDGDPVTDGVDFTPWCRQSCVRTSSDADGDTQRRVE